jgi:CBS domain-containing protein
MQAGQLMTREVVSVSPVTPTDEIARLLLEHRISAVPVVDATGLAVGMVSEGDLLGRGEADREARRDWWLALLAEGGELHPDFLASLRKPELVARDVMAAPVVRVTETTEAAEIASILAQYRIKRVPVVRDGKVVGIVSRGDLLRAIASEPPHGGASEHVARTHSLLTEALATLDRHFFGHHPESDAASPPAQGQAVAAGGLSVADFRSLVTGYAHHRAELVDAERRAAAESRRATVKRLIDEHVGDENWKALLHRARGAAERGEREFQLLRFPSDLCSDAGRAINVALPDWPKSLRGEAAELYLRWESELKPRGFHLSARVLDYPHGMPGDIGLFLGWGE